MRQKLFPGERRPLIFGHRGYSSLAPENTLPAFQKCVDMGVPGVELDIQRAATGEYIVLHDLNLKRITGFDALATETPIGQIRELDAGVWYGEEFRRTKIPLLSEVFELLGDKVYYDIEIKHLKKNDHLFGEELLKLIRSHGLSHRCLVSSFNPLAVRRRAFFQEVPGALIYSSNNAVPWYLRGGEGILLSRWSVLKPHYQQVTRFTMALDRLLGFPVIPWTVDSKEEAEQLLRLGVEGFISNKPGDLLPLLK